LETALAPGTFEVQMTVPRGFEAYARIFFPFVGQAEKVEGQYAEQHVTWRELAGRNGRAFHALMERETVDVGADGEATYGETYGELAPEQLAALVPILSRHTISTRGLFLLWDGFGDLNERAFDDGGAKVRHPGRDYYLLRGPLGAFEDFPHDPSYWWPDDRAWCLCGDIDFEWAYLAGTPPCVEEVLSVPVIDAVETRLENPAHSGMDVLNDPNGEVPRSV
jgi:hypothetical protein